MSAPGHLEAKLSLPGSDPADINIPRLHRLVRQRKRPVHHAAQGLGTTIDAVRHVLDEQPAPEHSPAENAARATGRICQQARQRLPKEHFAQLYLDEHLSLQEIATLTGFSRKVLTEPAKEYGIALHNGHQDYRHRS